MTDTPALMVAAGLVYLALLIALLRDRYIIKARCALAEGRVTGLTLDLEATRARLLETQLYLVRPESWRVEPPPPIAPARLRDPVSPDRWSVRTTAQARVTEAPVVSPANELARRDRSCRGPTAG